MGENIIDKACRLNEKVLLKIDEYLRALPYDSVSIDDAVELVNEAISIGLIPNNTYNQLEDNIPSVLLVLRALNIDITNYISFLIY